MSTLKVDTIRNYDSAVDFSQGMKVGGLDILQNYTESGSEPSSPSNGDYWWDSSNNKLYRYMDGGFKELGTTSNAIAWGGNRGLAVSSRHDSSNSLSAPQIDYFDMTVASNAADFGDLSGTYQSNDRAFSSSARGIFTRDENDDMDYVTISTPGNATDFGDLRNSDRGMIPTSDGTYGAFAGGNKGTNATWTNEISYVTIATPGNATDFGDRTSIGGYGGGAGGTTRGLFFGGRYISGNTQYVLNIIDYITIANPGNATDFGDLSANSAYGAAASDKTRAVHSLSSPDASDGNATNAIEYVTVDTTGNATDFGDLTKAKLDLGACGNGTRVVFCGGDDASSNPLNEVEYITVQTTGNAYDLLDLSYAGESMACCAGNAS